MNSKLISAAVFSLIVLIVTLFFWWRRDDGFSNDREVAAAQREFVELLDSPASQDTPLGKVVRVKKLKAGELPNFTSEQAKDFATGIMPDLMASTQQRFQRILDLPPAEQNKELDRIIDAQREMMSKLADRNDQTFTSNKHGNEQEASVVVDGSTSEGTRWISDNTTPEMRATMDAYAESIQQRMKERGMKVGDVPIMMSVAFEAEK